MYNDQFDINVLDSAPEGYHTTHNPHPIVSQIL